MMNFERHGHDKSSGGGDWEMNLILVIGE